MSVWDRLESHQSRLGRIQQVGGEKQSEISHCFGLDRLLYLLLNFNLNFILNLHDFNVKTNMYVQTDLVSMLSPPPSFPFFYR